MTPADLDELERRHDGLEHKPEAYAARLYVSELFALIAEVRRLRAVLQLADTAVEYIGTWGGEDEAWAARKAYEQARALDPDPPEGER